MMFFKWQQQMQSELTISRERIRDLEAKVNSLESSRDLNTQAIETLAGSCAESTGASQAARVKTRSLNESVKFLQDKIEALRGGLGVVIESVGEHQTEINALKRAMHETAERVCDSEPGEDRSQPHDEMPSDWPHRIAWAICQAGGRAETTHGFNTRMVDPEGNGIPTRDIYRAMHLIQRNGWL